MTLNVACSEDRRAEPPTQEASPVATGDPYVGIWVNLKNPSKGLSIRSEGASYAVENENGEAFTAAKANDGILWISVPIGSIEVLHIKSSDQIVAAGEEYKRSDPNGPEGHRWVQKRTMADMRSIAAAWEARATDTNSFGVGDVDGDVSYNALSNVLVPVYAKRLPSKDGWGTHFTLTVSSHGGEYSIRSLGANRQLDESPNGATATPESDILFSNGNFVVYPEGLQDWPAR